MKLLFLLIFSFNVHALETVNISESIVIFSPIEKACEFISNPLNDYIWRSEVNTIIQEGNTFVEDAWIGIRRNFITVTELVDSSCPAYSHFITVPENPYYLSSHRSFSVINEHSSRFTYTVDFDVKMIKETFGFEAKPKVVRELYRILMRSYMRRLAFSSLSW